MTSLPHIKTVFQSSSVWIPPLFPSKLQIKKQQQKRQISYTAELTYTSLPAIKIAQLTIAFSKDT